MPPVTVVERDYPNTYRRFTALGPLMSKLGNGGKGIAWNTEHEVELPEAAQWHGHRGRTDQGLAEDRNRHRRGRGDPGSRAGDERRGRRQGLEGAVEDHRPRTHPSRDPEGRRENPLPRHRGAAAQDHLGADLVGHRESEKVCYNAGYTNVHELIPWRTLTGRQQLYQDHLWMRAFGEALCVYRPPVDTQGDQAGDRLASRNGEKQIVLNFITPHQKWGIHSTYTDNLLMLTLSRGGPIVWISETDAEQGRHRR